MSALQSWEWHGVPVRGETDTCCVRLERDIKRCPPDRGTCPLDSSQTPPLEGTKQTNCSQTPPPILPYPTLSASPLRMISPCKISWYLDTYPKRYSVSGPLDRSQAVSLLTYLQQLPPIPSTEAPDIVPTEQSVSVIANLAKAEHGPPGSKRPLEDGTDDVATKRHSQKEPSIPTTPTDKKTPSDEEMATPLRKAMTAHEAHHQATHLLSGPDILLSGDAILSGLTSKNPPSTEQLATFCRQIGPIIAETLVKTSWCVRAQPRNSLGNFSLPTTMTTNMICSLPPYPRLVSQFAYASLPVMPLLPPQPLPFEIQPVGVAGLTAG